MVMARACRIAARTRPSGVAPGAGGHGTSSEAVPPVQPEAAARIVSRLSPRTHRADAAKQPLPQPRTPGALTPARGPASVIETVNRGVLAPFSCGVARCTTICPALAV